MMFKKSVHSSTAASTASRLFANIDTHAHPSAGSCKPVSLAALVHCVDPPPRAQVLRGNGAE
eukprot:1154731-Pelagomonas_calceolata.AAC.1